MICDRFIHIHIPRTGGTLIRGVADQCVFDAKILKPIETKAHMHLLESKQLAPTAPTFAFVRNPFDWYVSMYHRDVDTGKFAGTFRRYFWERMGRGETLTKMWADFMDGQGVDSIGRFESLVFDVVEILSKFVPEVRPVVFMRSIERLGKVRESTERMPYQLYYNDEKIEAIKELDKDYLAKFGYAFKPIKYNADGIHFGPGANSW